MAFPIKRLHTREALVDCGRRWAWPLRGRGRMGCWLFSAGWVPGRSSPGCAGCGMGPVWGETAKLVNSRQYADAASVAIGNNCLSDELHQHLYAASFTLMAPWGHRVAWGV